MLKQPAYELIRLLPRIKMFKNIETMLGYWSHNWVNILHNNVLQMSVNSQVNILIQTSPSKHGLIFITCRIFWTSKQTDILMTYSKLYIYLKIILYKFYLIERKLHFTKTCLMQTLPHNKPVPFTIWFPRNFLPKKMCYTGKSLSGLDSCYIGSFSGHFFEFGSSYQGTVAWVTCLFLFVGLLVFPALYTT